MTPGADYTIVGIDEVDDPSGDYPGELRMFTGPLATGQMAFTYRRMPPQTGGMRGLRWGHSHKTQEEIYFVLSGTLCVKVDEEQFEIGPKTAVRFSPEAVRAVWNDGEEDVELVMCSVRVEDLRAEAEVHRDFWQD
jgi:mannose-6-phosphate isomerase-like protein (cupin superfamily)